MANIISNAPRCSNQLISVGDAISKLPAFNAIYEAGKDGSINHSGCNPNEAAAWRKQVYDQVLNCSGRPTELDFFEKAFNSAGKTNRLEATDLYIKYNCDFDYNIYAQAASVGSAPGAATTFTILRALHAGNGKYTNASVGGEIYIYEDAQWARIMSIDATVDYAHTVTVLPLNKDYTVNIRAGKKILFQPVRFVDGYSCASPSSTWMTPGYINRISPIQLRDDWEQPIDLSKGYQDILQFAILFDNEGRQIEGWLPYEQIRARERFKMAKNEKFFMGQRTDNPALIGTGLTLTTDKYAGFDGYLSTMRFGGGTVKDYRSELGPSLEADFLPIIKTQNALKRSKEFMVLNGFDFMLGLVRNNGEVFKQAAGQNNLNVFKQMGADMDVIQKLDIKQYSYMNYRFSFKDMDALSDTRSIGNYDMPYLGMFMPLDGVRNSSGQNVNAIEFFMPHGMGETGTYSESPIIDHRFYPDSCMKWSGWVMETLMMAIHCPQLHILMRGVVPCA
jgi:hypothetical protein